MSVILLPCPFCGAEAKNEGHRSCDCCGKAYTGIISCTKCKAEVSHLDTDAEAIAAWNARAPAQAAPGSEVWETVRKVSAAREKGYAAARANLQEAWAALAMIRETVETLAPSGSVKAAEHLDGPTFMHEAEALVAGILALTSTDGKSPQSFCGESDCTFQDGWCKCGMEG